MRPDIKDVPGLLDDMWVDHLCDMTFNDLERKYKRGAGNIKAAFVKAGLRIVNRGNCGCFAKTLKRHTAAEIRAAVNGTKRFVIPPALRQEWREWWMEKRSKLIELLVKKHGWPNPPPSGPYSRNVKCFDYTTPAAQEIIARTNAGKPSQQWQTHIKICSQGVIFEGGLYCWVKDTGYIRGGFVRRLGREALHRILYERHHGPIPPGGVVRHADGNKNNFEPKNLVLATKDDVARETQAKYSLRRSREKTAALLNLKPTRHESAILFSQSRSRRRTRAAKA